MVGFGVEHVLAQEQDLAFRGINVEHDPLDWFGRFGCLWIVAESHGVALVDAFFLKNGTVASSCGSDRGDGGLDCRLRCFGTRGRKHDGAQQSKKAWFER